jgi:hypothetical protein
MSYFAWPGSSPADYVVEETARTEAAQESRQTTRSSAKPVNVNVSYYFPTQKVNPKKPTLPQAVSESDLEASFHTAREEDIAHTLNSSILGGEQDIVDLDPINFESLFDIPPPFGNYNMSEQAPPPSDNTGGSQGRRPSRSPSETGSTKKANQPRAMPGAWTGKHPTYDADDPSTATWFFEGVEMAVQNAGLMEDDKEIVTNALSYLKVDTA